MNKKRLIALALAFVMLFALAACGQSGSAAEETLKEGVEAAVEPAAEPAVEPAAEPTLVGKWECEKDIRELLIAEMGDTDQESLDALSSYENPILLAMELEFREDGTCTLTPDMSKTMESLREFIRLYFVKSFESSGLTMDDDFIDGLIDASMEQMGEEFSPIDGTYEKDGNTLRLGGSDPVPYALDGDTLSISVEGFGDLQFVRLG